MGLLKVISIDTPTLFKICILNHFNVSFAQKRAEPRLQMFCSLVIYGYSLTFLNTFVLYSR